jgi:hypothetical protein
MPGNDPSGRRSRDALIAEVQRRAARRRLHRRGTIAAVAGLAVAASVAVPLALANGGRTTSVNMIVPPSSSTTQRSAAPTPSNATTLPPSTTIGPTTRTTLPPRPESVNCSQSAPSSDTHTSGSATAIEAQATARVSWTAMGSPGTSQTQGARVELTFQGRILLDELLSPVVPVNDPSTGQQRWESLLPVCVELSAGGQPMVYLSGYSFAMTCCGVVRTYYPLSDGSYVTVDWDAGRSYPMVEDLDGKVVVVDTNRDFNVRFGCGACAAAPIQILRVEGGHYVDVTRDFPVQIANDAQQHWSQYQARPDAADAMPVLPAWAADECELGRQSETFATLDSLAASGQLNPPPGSPPTTYPFGPTGAAYVSAVHTFLKQAGYCN